MPSRPGASVPETKSSDEGSDIWGQVVQELTSLDIRAEGGEGAVKARGECPETKSSDEGSDIWGQVVEKLRDWGGHGTASKCEGNDCLVVNHDDGYMWTRLIIERSTNVEKRFFFFASGKSGRWPSLYHR